MKSREETEMVLSEHSDRTSVASCPVCGATSCESHGPAVFRSPPNVGGVPIDLTGLQTDYMECLVCGYHFIHDIPEDTLLECYRNVSENHWDTRDDDHDTRNYAYKKSVLLKFAEGQKVLDVGCFDGGFLDFLGSDFERFGIEPGSAARRLAASRGVEIVGGTIDDATNGECGPFDVITMFDVVEHLKRPVQALRSVRKLLAPGGIVMLETGNSQSKQWRSVGKRYNYCALPEHVGFFCRKSIDRASQLAGFELAFFEESAHHRFTRLQLAEAYLKNTAFHLLRAADRLRLPLTKKLARLANGPLPRSTNLKDHFLAVLRPANYAEK